MVHVSDGVTVNQLIETSTELQKADIQITFEPSYDNGDHVGFELKVAIRSIISQYGIDIIESKTEIVDPNNTYQISNLVREVKLKVKSKLKEALMRAEKEYTGKVSSFRNKVEDNEKLCAGVKDILECL